MMDLGHYRQVSLGRRPPAYVRSDTHRLGDVDLRGLTTTDLWSIHDAAMPASGGQADDGPSLLNLKIEIVRRMMTECVLCERRCGVDRMHGETGFCGVGAGSSYFSEQLLWGEEGPLIPSHEVFFSGCNMRCRFCYSWESLLNTSHGRPFVPDEFARTVERRRRDGAVNLNLIGGEPTVHLMSILECLKSVSEPTAIVWNSNFLMSEETMRILDGIVDLYVGDFRFGNDSCATTIGRTDGYVVAAKRNFETAARSGDLIIRHLVLPGHVECCLRPIAEWAAEHLPETPFNLMFQYLPYFEALEDPALARVISPEEETRALEIVESLGLNTRRWNTPLSAHAEPPRSSGESISTSIVIRPDGKVVIKDLHGELIELVDLLQNGGTADGGPT